jgi:hypothetical protein
VVTLLGTDLRHIIFTRGSHALHHHRTAVLSLIMFMSGMKSNAEATRGILQPALISSYTSYLTWSAVSQTTDRCLPNDNDPSDWLTLVVGFVLTLVVIVNASTMYIDPEAVKVDEAASSKTTTTDENGDKVTVIQMYTPRDNEVNMVQYVWWAFHVQIALACCFMQVSQVPGCTVLSPAASPVHPILSVPQAPREAQLGNAHRPFSPCIHGIV